jgi:hypothetical protein
LVVWLVHWFQFCYCYNSTHSLPLGATVQHLCVMERERDCMNVCVQKCT